MRIALKFAYDGEGFYGFAKQPNLITIEGEILKILNDSGYIDDIKKSVFRYASRTDKSVSAFGNVISFNTDKSIKNIFNKVNEHNNKILFYGIKKVKDDFNPRYADHRIYSYYLINEDLKKLDIDKLITACSLFIGTHNFSNFARIETKKNPIRTINNIFVNFNKFSTRIDFHAQTFLWNQIRRIMSAIIKFNNLKIEKIDIINALNNPIKYYDFGVAPPEELVLKDIVYNFSFEYDEIFFKKLNFFKKNLKIFKHL